MGAFWTKVEKLFPNMTDSLDDTGSALAHPNIFSDFIQGGAMLGGLVGGVIGLGLGIAALAGMVISAPIATLALMHVAGGFAVPGVAALALGAVGMGIGFAGSYALRAGFGLVGAVLLGLSDTANLVKSSLTQTQRTVAKAVELRNKRLGLEDRLERYAADGEAPYLKDALPQDVYGKLSDGGKIGALGAIFGARAQQISSDKEPRKDSRLLQGFARNAQKILDAEENRRQNLSPREKKKEAVVASATEKALQKPENRVIRGAFGEVLRRY